jgi:hypothetical protein
VVLVEYKVLKIETFVLLLKEIEVKLVEEEVLEVFYTTLESLLEWVITP